MKLNALLFVALLSSPFTATANTSDDLDKKFEKIRQSVECNLIVEERGNEAKEIPMRWFDSMIGSGFMTEDTNNDRRVIAFAMMAINAEELPRVIAGAHIELIVEDKSGKMIGGVKAPPVLISPDFISLPVTLLLGENVYYTSCHAKEAQEQ